MIVDHRERVLAPIGDGREQFGDHVRELVQRFYRAYNG